MSKLLSTILLLYASLFIITAQNIQLDIQGQLQIKKDAANGAILQTDAAGLGTWVTPAYQERKEIDVTNFGAIADFSTDNTTAFQNAIDSAAMIGAIVHIPAGNYVLKGQLTVPGGVVLEGESVGGDYHKFSNVVRGSCIIYEGVEYVAEFRGFFSGAKNLYFYNGSSAGSKAAGGFKLVAEDGTFSTGYNTFSNLYFFNFFEGTCFQIAATNNSTIAHVLVEDILFRFPETGMHVLAETGSTIQHITLHNGKIGGGSRYSFRNQGGTNINAYGTTFEGIGCGSVGHLVVESGNINIYGFRIESTDSEGRCDESEVIIAHFYPNTQGSYIRGLTGDGRVVDEGENYLDANGNNTERRPSNSNELENAAFRGVTDGQIPYWKWQGTPSTINSLAPAFENNHQVLQFTIPAGQIVQLSPEQLPATLHRQLAAFGAYIKCASPNVAFCRMQQYELNSNNCTTRQSVFHTGDNQWQYIGLTTTINSNSCLPSPVYTFDNSANATAATVALTTPSFVYGHTRPTLLSKPILNSGGRLDGTLTTGMVTFPIVVDSRLELTLPPDGNTFYLTGTAGIHRLNNDVTLGTRFPKGTVLTLLFESAGVTVRNWAYINLRGTANYTSTVGSSLTLVALDHGVWREIGRNI